MGTVYFIQRRNALDLLSHQLISNEHSPKSCPPSLEPQPSPQTDSIPLSRSTDLGEQGDSLVDFAGAEAAEAEH